MPEQPLNTRPIIAMVMGISAVSLLVIAALVYSGTIPLPEETRLIAASAVGAAGFADFCVGVWFFRKGQSS